MRLAAAWGIVLGLLVFGQWAFFIATGRVPEFETAPREIAFHLAAEALFAAGLLVAGVGLLRRRAWARTLYLVATGMTACSIVVSSGYFAQRDNWGIVVMFAVVLVVSVAAVVALVRRTG